MSLSTRVRSAGNEAIQVDSMVKQKLKNDVFCPYVSRKRADQTGFWLRILGAIISQVAFISPVTRMMT
jgi:hypothetical protein